MAKTTQNESTTPIISIISAGTLINGDIKTNGDIRIDGQLVGNLTATGRVVIGGSGQVEGEIHCQIGDFSGKVKGKIFVAETLSLRASASITGDIKVQKISIEP